MSDETPESALTGSSLSIVDLIFLPIFLIGDFRTCRRSDGLREGSQKRHIYINVEIPLQRTKI